MTTLTNMVNNLLGFKLTKLQEDSFQLYTEEILFWNKHSNITRIIDNQEIIIQHFLDSLSCLLAIQTKNITKHSTKIVDIGSGAGFPGIPLAIVNPHYNITLIESTKKKYKFLKHIINKLQLTNIRIINNRAEIIGQQSDHREYYDWAIARAVAELPVLIEYLLPFTHINGFCIAQKTYSAYDEITNSTKALSTLGGRLERVIPVSLPSMRKRRYLIVIKKTCRTPSKYPRRPGIPTKKPIH
ncbi:MAG TPA: 16S rRNA (guanine(527)-N(7))-methyltransferase RsmG [Chloroflexi bacterium]|nr:16S rRNA (guanine(527)-N(7))-methyltransferase RsmG [Chloroflexota bacterium]